jgi:site-specific DNA-cytosine methylase
VRELVFDADFIFCGLGLGALGFINAELELPNLGVKARFRARGGIDFDPLGCKDFEYLTGAPALCADVETLTVEQVRAFLGPKAPHALFWSPPCKGASGLLSAEKAKTEKYERMNQLALVWYRLMRKAWADVPTLLILENVPRLKTRAAPMLRELKRLMRRDGYVLHEGFHDCAEIGGLAQHRRRYLLVARQPKACPALLYQPPTKRVRGCGEVLGELPVPGTPAAAAWGRMHELPKISWLNWVRLALIPAGGDWRDLEGVLAEGQERREVHRRHAVEQWDEPTGSVTGSGSNAVGAVADPRVMGFKGAYGVKAWDEPAGVVTGQNGPGNGAFAVADPRIALNASGNKNAHNNKYRMVGWDKPAGTVIGATRPGSGLQSVADPRAELAFPVDQLRVKRAYDAGYAVLHWSEAARTIAGKTAAGCGAYSVADPRVDCAPRAGAYGVIGFDQPAGTVTASLQIDNGPAAVADPRKPPSFLPVIIAADGTWHRPMTRLELAALQGFPMFVRGKPLHLAGKNMSLVAERVGNAVPEPAARAIARQMLATLTYGAVGHFQLSSEAVWVEPQEALHG